MKLSGWDLEFWRQKFSVKSCIVQSIAGNMWSMYHFLPIHVALMGTEDFTEAKFLANKKRQEAKKEAAEKKRWHHFV